MVDPLISRRLAIIADRKLNLVNFTARLFRFSGVRQDLMKVDAGGVDWGAHFFELAAFFRGLSVLFCSLERFFANVFGPAWPRSASASESELRGQLKAGLAHVLLNHGKPGLARICSLFVLVRDYARPRRTCGDLSPAATDFGRWAGSP